jgi:hypothetical protein
MLLQGEVPFIRNNIVFETTHHEVTNTDKESNHFNCSWNLSLGNLSV